MSETTSSKVKVQLDLVKSTKGTHVYGNAEHGINLYFPKTLPIFKGDEAPQVLQMTLAVG